MIYRTNPNDNFTKVPNELIRSDLSDGAFRLLAFMLSLPDDWSFSVAGLASMLNTSKNVVSFRVKELRQAGYIVIKQDKTETGKFKSNNWDVYDIPNRVQVCRDTVCRDTVCRDTVCRDTVCRDSENWDNTNTIYTKTNNTKTNSTKTKGNILSRPSISEIADYCSERNNGIDPQAFFDYYEANGWVQGKSKKPVKDWKACVRTWESRNKHKPKPISDRPKTFEELLNDPPNNPFTDLLKQEGYSI